MILLLVASGARGEWRMRQLGAWGGAVQAVAVDGQYVYMGSGTRLLVLDQTDPSSLRQVAAIDFGSDGDVRDIVFSDDLLYVMAGGTPSFVRVLDVSDPRYPTELGAREAPYQSFKALAVSGPALFAAGDGVNGVWIYDVSDPGNIVLVHEEWKPVGGTWEMVDLRVVDDMLYGTDLGDGELHIVRVDDPFTPSLFRTFEGIDHPLGLDVDGGLVYVTTLSWDPPYLAGFLVIDPLSPPHWEPVGEFLTEGLSGTAYLEVVEGVAYVCTRESGLVVVDVSSPSNPTELTRYEAPPDVQSMAFASDVAYLADCGEGLLIVDVSNPADPQPVGKFESPGALNRLTVDGDLLYVASDYVDFTIVDVSDPRRMSTVGQYASEGVWGSYYGGALELMVRGNFAYVSSDGDGFEIVDVSDPGAPVKVSGIPTTTETWAFDIEGDRAYVCNLNEAFKIVNIEDPYNPTVIGTPLVEKNALDVLVSDGIYYAATQTVWKIIDVAPPVFEQLWAGNPPLGGFAKSGSLLYCGVSDLDFPSSLEIYDVSVPSAPVLVGATYDDERALGLALRPDGLVLLMRGATMFLWDVSNPGAPTYLTETPVLGENVSVNGRYAFTSDKDTAGVGAFLIFQPGDFDQDGDVDLVDYGNLQRCWRGSGVEPVLADCLIFDVDEDDDVDSADLAQFQTYYTGPQ